MLLVVVVLGGCAAEDDGSYVATSALGPEDVALTMASLDAEHDVGERRRASVISGAPWANERQVRVTSEEGFCAVYLVTRLKGGMWGARGVSAPCDAATAPGP